MHPKPPSIAAVVVSYNPSRKSFSHLIESLNKQVCETFLVDNSENEIQTLNYQNLSTTKLKENLGLSRAQNIGISQALDAGYEFILLMDQDSLPEKNMVSELHKAFLQLTNSGKQVAAVGPQFIDNQTKKLSRFPTLKVFPKFLNCRSHNDLVPSQFLISSGSLIHSKALQDIGLMHNDLFIDHIDTEWAFKAQSKGWKLYGCCKAKMAHSIGEYRKRIWLGKWRDLPIHKPQRYYYVFRNSIWLSKMKHVSTTWSCVNMLRNLALVAIVFLIHENRFSVINQSWQGIKDGLSQPCKA